MTPSARLAAVAEILSLQFTDPKCPLDALVRSWLRGKRYVGGGDRRAILHLLYSIQRCRARLLWHLEGSDSVYSLWPDDITPSSARDFVIAASLLITNISRDEMHEMLHDNHYGLGPIQGADRDLINRLTGCSLTDPRMPDWVQMELPEWIASDLKTVCPDDELKALMSAMNAEARVDLRVNTLALTRDAAISRLKEEGITATALFYATHGLKIDRRVNLAINPTFKAGGVEPQDEGAQIVALLCDPKPGSRVADVCAGAGGKALALAALMENQGKIIACDISAGRLHRSTQRLRRAGVFNTETRPLSSETDPWIKRHKASFDTVLLDVPCSGSGVWRRNPEARWRPHAKAELEHLCALQKRILTSASRLCKPEGMLAYVTCSLLEAENQAQIDSFLAENSNFSPIDMSAHIQDIATRKGNESLASLASQAQGTTLQLWPHRNGCDGFFIAFLRRKALAVS